ncbi:MAG: pentapeptide repeat-containing protein [Gammaproteobacteria bacterium]
MSALGAPAKKTPGTEHSDPGAVSTPRARVQEWLAAIRDEGGPPAGMDRTILRGAQLIGADLSNLDLSGYDLSGADLSRADLAHTRLMSANLRGTVLFEANLRDSVLLSADLTGANLSSCSAENAGFESADLTDATFFSASLRGATFIKATLQGTDLRATDLQHARLRDADLRNADFSRSNLQHADLEGSSVDGATFVDAELPHAHLRGLRGYTAANWIGADVHDINFTGAYLTRRTIMDQNYLHEFRIQSRINRVIYWLWWVSSDCGRSFLRWGAWIIIVLMLFAFLFTFVALDYGEYPTYMSSVYFSVVTLTTLGYGDVVPASPMAQVLAIIEVVFGYVMLGGLLSIFANKMARRAD